MSGLLHRLRSAKPDPVTGDFTTRCGLVGSRDRRQIPRVKDEGEAFHNERGRFLTAISEVSTTCPKCRLKVTPTERKVLRIMFDYSGQVLLGVRFRTAKKFDWHAGTSLTFYCPETVPDDLRSKGLLQIDMTKEYALSINGRLLAQTYPKVMEEVWGKPKGPKRK